MTSMLEALCILVKHLKLRFLITYEGGSEVVREVFKIYRVRKKVIRVFATSTSSDIIF